MPHFDARTAVDLMDYESLDIMRDRAATLRTKRPRVEIPTSTNVFGWPITTLITGRISKRATVRVQAVKAKQVVKPNASREAARVMVEVAPGWLVSEKALAAMGRLKPANDNSESARLAA